MNGQLDFFDLIEVQQAQEIKMCTTCANCKTTDLGKNEQKCRRMERYKRL